MLQLTCYSRISAHRSSLFALARRSRRNTASACQVAPTYAATIVVGLAAQQAGRPDLIRSPKRVLVHTWEGLLE